MPKSVNKRPVRRRTQRKTLTGGRDWFKFRSSKSKKSPNTEQPKKRIDKGSISVPMHGTIISSEPIPNFNRPISNPNFMQQLAKNNQNSTAYELKKALGIFNPTLGIEYNPTLEKYTEIIKNKLRQQPPGGEYFGNNTTKQFSQKRAEFIAEGQRPNRYNIGNLKNLTTKQPSQILAEKKLNKLYEQVFSEKNIDPNKLDNLAAYKIELLNKKKKDLEEYYTGTREVGEKPYYSPYWTYERYVNTDKVNAAMAKYGNDLSKVFERFSASSKPPNT